MVRILWNPEFLQPLQNSLTQAPILSQMNTVYTLPLFPSGIFKYHPAFYASLP